MKYIIEIKPEYEANGIMILGARDSHLYVTTLEVKDLEELNSDYINEHYGDLQDTAYQKGFEDGKKTPSELASNAEYQRGLDDAWEAAKKVALNTNDGGLSFKELDEIFDRYTLQQVFKEYTAKQTIEKLKAYEQKQNDKIEVGDEVEWDNDFTGDRFIVTRIYQPYGKKEQCDGIDDDGDVYRAVLIESLVKTGRHFDIASILEDMKS